MSELYTKSLKMDATIVLTEREVEMLAWLAGYGGKQIAEAICKNLTKEYKAEEWDKLWIELREGLEAARNRFRDVRNVFVGNKHAIWPVPQERQQ